MTRRSAFNWTMERRCDLLALKEQGKSNSFCAMHFGVPKPSVEQALHRIRKEQGEALRSYRRLRPYIRRTDSRVVNLPAIAKAKIVRAQLPLPETITAFLCGDPLPGRSALDRKRLGIVEEPSIEAHSGVRPNHVTLPKEPMRCD